MTSFGQNILGFGSGGVAAGPPYTLEYLVVAGGGSGGFSNGGGGGGGGMRSASTTVNAGKTYTITVGAGGAGRAAGSPTQGDDGGDSIINGLDISSFTSTGGGGGGHGSQP